MFFNSNSLLFFVFAVFLLVTVQSDQSAGLKGSFLQKPALKPTLDMSFTKLPTGKESNRFSRFDKQQIAKVPSRFQPNFGNNQAFNGFLPQLNQPSFGKQNLFGGNSLQKSDQFKFQPSFGLIGWGAQPSSGKQISQWNGKIVSNSDSFKFKPPMESTFGSQQKLSAARPLFPNIENGKNIEINGNGKNVFVNAFNGGSGFQFINNSPQTIAIANSGNVNKILSDNDVDIKVKVNTGNLNKNFVGGDMKSGIYLNLFNSVDIDTYGPRALPATSQPSLSNLLPLINGKTLAQKQAGQTQPIGSQTFRKP